MMTNAIVPLDPEDGLPERWNDIVDQLIQKYNFTDIAPERVIRAVELFISGYDTHKVARELGVKPATVRGWLENYPMMRQIIAEGKKSLVKWRMARIEQQFVRAIDKSEEILNLDLHDREVNAKVLAVVAQQARFIIGLMANQTNQEKADELEREQELLKAKQDALAYIAQELVSRQKGKKEDVIEGEYKEAPLLDINGEPFYGQFGVLDVDRDGILCHVCGKRYKNLLAHIRQAHRLNARDYEITFLLDEGEIKRCQQNR